MNWRTLGLLLCTLVTIDLSGQGKIRFENIREGEFAPIGFAGGLLGGGFFAELALAGSRILVAGPSPFIANGFFVGEEHTVPGVPAGESIRVWLVVSDESGQAVAVSEPFGLVLGDEEVKSSLLNDLKGLNISSTDKPRYVWIEDFSTGFSRRCVVAEPVILIVVFADDRRCIEEEERLTAMKEMLQITVPKLEHSISSDGTIELSWLAGSQLELFGVGSIKGRGGQRVVGDVFRDGYRVINVMPDQPQMFYWLAQSDETVDSR